MAVSPTPTSRAIETTYRLESPRLIAGLMRLVKDVGRAEELAQDALVIALEKWPSEGVPDNPGAWLMTTARNRALNVVVRAKKLEMKHQQVGAEIDLERELNAVDLDAALDDTVGDDLLRLVFIACHPVLSGEAQAALALRLLGGLTTEEIARAFLVPEPTIAQRIVRAKRTLAEAKVPFEVPRASELPARLASVLAVVYLIFNEGYSATSGDDVQRPALCDEAMRLGRVLVSLMAAEPEVHGLLALMELHASRSEARRSPTGEHVLLLDQDRTRWDPVLIRRGLEGLARAIELGGGVYTLQAAISACHARAAAAADTDWSRIAAIYEELAARTPSPVIELNRAVAVAMAEGPAAGLAIIDRLQDEPALARYHLLPAARADLLKKLGRLREAQQEFERAASLTKNERERADLTARARACAG
ncbi:MAG: polymerase subunit sigma-24 [Labilithrix sp.]|nr:polymerase subunit sigma-24 [Labilithrix sp.]